MSVKKGGSQYIDSYGQKHYQKNKKKYLADVKMRRQRNRDYVREVRSQAKCVDCKINDWRLIDFDHIDGKEFTIAKMVNDGYSIDRIQSEIDKCEPVCANCHRIRTYTRANITKNALII